jgi:hypothetical protein
MLAILVKALLFFDSALLLLKGVCGPGFYDCIKEIDNHNNS